MEKFLFLSHLPSKLAYHPTLDYLKQEAGEPDPGDVARALCGAGYPQRGIWETINIALRMAQATCARVGRSLSVASYWTEHYPPSLRDLANPPWNIFYLGALPSPTPTLAIVGSRKPDGYGVRLVSDFVTRLTTRPLQIVSGLAYGIDALAHHYSCASQIPNFAVLGSGVDVVYPAAHADLADRIVASGGGLLSELPPGTPPLPHHFPSRNRIISGLAEVVWVVQGTAYSGSYHTAKHALTQGRTVAACPGDVYSELSQIPNRLIFEGAQPLLRPADLDGLLCAPNGNNCRNMPVRNDRV